METVQLQCGHCKQVIAIDVEHLGGQVECPHCKGVLQTPPRTPQAETPAAPLPNMELKERESIFAGPEASDVAAGVTPAPKVELPGDTGFAPGAAGSEPNAEFTKFKPRPVFDRGVFTMYALIFLVPYAILTTLAVAYFLFIQSPPARIHPFDMLQDPAPLPKQGGPKKISSKRIDPLGPLAEHQKVPIGKTIRVGKDGNLEATPEKVSLVDGDLRLYLRVENISTNTAFTPMADSYLRYNPNKPDEKPYSYLESSSGAIERIFNAYLAYRKNTTDNEEGKDSLAPREQTVIMLKTPEEYQKPHVAAIVKSNDTFIWRVQLRRGFVKHEDKDKSATAVIGVEFTSAQIEGRN